MHGKYFPPVLSRRSGVQPRNTRWLLIQEAVAITKCFVRRKSKLGQSALPISASPPSPPSPTFFFFVQGM